MRKSLGITTAFLFMILAVSAQQTALWNASFSAGPSFPVGNFGNSQWDSIPGRSGAKPGVAVQIQLIYQLKNRHIGIGLVTGWQENAGNITPVKDGLLIYNPDPYQIRVQMNHWNVWKILAGPEFRWPVSKKGKLSFETGIEAGILKTSIPAYSYQVYFADTHNWSATGNIAAVSLPVSFCYQVHAGMEYRIHSHMLLRLDGSFSHAEPSVQQYQYGFPPNMNFAVMKKYSYSVSSVNILFGISCEF